MKKWIAAEVKVVPGAGAGGTAVARAFGGNGHLKPMKSKRSSHFALFCRIVKPHLGISSAFSKK